MFDRRPGGSILGSEGAATSSRTAKRALQTSRFLSHLTLQWASKRAELHSVTRVVSIRR
jgi:hypothetical protein